MVGGEVLGGPGLVSEVCDVLLPPPHPPIVILPEGVADPGWRIGEKVRVITNHACGTANMHEELIAVDGERIVDRWRVIGRGRVR